MNIEIIGRIRPSIRAEGPENLVIEGHRVAAHLKCCLPSPPSVDQNCKYIVVPLNTLPILFTRIYNATDAVPIPFCYYLQEYIMLQKRYKN
jgi:hypothetical protein